MLTPVVDCWRRDVRISFAGAAMMRRTQIILGKTSGEWHSSAAGLAALIPSAPQCLRHHGRKSDQSRTGHRRQKKECRAVAGLDDDNACGRGAERAAQAGGGRNRALADVEMSGTAREIRDDERKQRAEN